MLKQVDKSNTKETEDKKNLFSYEKIPSILGVKHSKRTLKFGCNFGSSTEGYTQLKVNAQRKLSK